MTSMSRVLKLLKLQMYCIVSSIKSTLSDARLPSDRIWDPSWAMIELISVTTRQETSEIRTGMLRSLKK